MKCKGLSLLLICLLLLSACSHSNVTPVDNAETLTILLSEATQKVKEQSGITALSLNDCNIYDVEHINISSSVTSLDLSDNKIMDISALARFQNLQELNLSGNSIVDISPLAELENLRKLNISENPITDISGLKALPLLESLTLSCETLENPLTLNELSNLTWLDIGSISIDEISSYQPIAAITAISLVGSSSKQTAETLLLLPDFPHLQALTLSGFNLDGADLGWLEHCSALQALSIPVLYENIAITLEKMPQLNELEIKYLEDGTSLANLTRLRKLSLFGAKNIQFVSGMKDLVSLSVIYNSDILDISPVASLTQLEELYVESRNLSDISPVAELNNLKKLSFNWCAVDDIQTLGGLSSLEYLDLSCNNISSIDMLKNLTSLKALELDRNYMRDISPISNLTDLEYLRMEACGTIPDLSPISSLKKITKLRIGDNSFTDLSPLIGLENLYYLEATSVKYRDITPLSQLSNLVYLNALNNNISDVSALAGLKNLQHLDLCCNAITSVDSLGDLNNLRYLDLSANQVADISSLSRLTGLYELELSGNSIQDVSPLSKLTVLKYLDLSNNLISDISALESLTQIDMLDLSSNSGISNFSVLTDLVELMPIINPSTSGKMDTTAYDVDIKTYEKNSIIIEYPQIKGLSDQDAAKEINSLLKDEVFAYVSDLLSSWGSDEEKDIYTIINDTTDSDLELHCSVGLNSKNILSFSYDVYGYGHGSAHPNTWGFAFTVDMESRKVMTLEDIFQNVDSLLNAKTLDMSYGLSTNRLGKIIYTLDDHSWYITDRSDMSFFFSVQNNYSEYTFSINQMDRYITSRIYTELNRYRQALE